MNGFVMGSSVVAVALSPLLALFAAAPPPEGGVALVVAAPWGKAAAQVAQDAHIQEIGPERAPIGVLVKLGDEGSVTRLYENGAWFVVNGQRILELCSS
ncbi:hypothetical protein [Gemmobacter denitrificans]|uniref:Uncharacterized protein n=1 Tax=Gemmobacter denitrificans TaxID=3123040 RepID=A0ABU8BPL2_9RHOB